MNTITLDTISGPHQNTSMAYIPALSEAKAMLILLHGRGATALSMLELSSYLEIPQHMVIVAPEASQLAWYPNDIKAPIKDNRAHVTSAIEVIEACLRYGEDNNIARTSTIVAGFSQGACITAEFLRTVRGANVSGAAILSGGIIGTDAEVANMHEADIRLKDVSIYMGSDKQDPYISVDRLEETRRILEGLQATVQLETFNDLGHGVNQEELNAIQRLLANTNLQIN